MKITDRSDLKASKVKNSSQESFCRRDEDQSQGCRDGRQGKSSLHETADLHNFFKNTNRMCQKIVSSFKRIKLMCS